MSPCDEYKKLVKEWKTAKSFESHWRGEAPASAKEQAEAFRKQGDSLKSAMERHVQVCNACKNS